MADLSEAAYFQDAVKNNPMSDEARKVAEDMRERAARECDRLAKEGIGWRGVGALKKAAAAIRALKVEE